MSSVPVKFEVCSCQQHTVSGCADLHNDAEWQSEVSEAIKSLQNLPSNAGPQAFSRVGSTQACRVLAALGIVECVGNDVHPILVNESTPASLCFDYSQYPNEDAGTPDVLKHHQAELTKFGVQFGRNAFTMFDLHLHENPYPITHDGQEYHGGLDGGVAPFGLSVGSAAARLRVAYQHKQSNDQKQRYREKKGATVQVLSPLLQELKRL